MSTTTVVEYAVHSRNVKKQKNTTTHETDEPAIDTRARSKFGLDIVALGICINLGMTLIQGIGGYIFHSQALTADAMHGLTDTFSDLFTLIITAEMFRSPRVTKHLGEGTVERFGGLCISILMLLGGAWTLWLSLVEVCLICFPQTAPLLQTINLFTQNSAGEHVAPDARAALFVLANIAAKDWIYRATIKIAKKTSSSVLEMHAVHQRMDSITALATLVSIVVARIVPNLTVVDAASGFIISNIAIRSGLKNLSQLS